MMVRTLPIAAAMLLGACSVTMPQGGSSDWSKVVGQDWQLVTVMTGDAAITPTTPVIASAIFSSDGQVAGSAGCNRYFGSYEQDGGALSLSGIGITKRLCMGDAMTVEDAFTTALNTVTAWQHIDGKLVLSDATDASVLEFEPMKPE